MRVFRYLVLGIVIGLASATLAQAQPTPLQDNCEIEIVPSEECGGGSGGDPVSDEFEVLDPVCPEGVSCSIEEPDYDLMCLERGFGRYHGYIGHTRIRLLGRTVIICWWWY
jgi:hypothetical protein